MKTKTLYGAFNAQAYKTPKATAIYYLGRKLSYSELKKQSDGVAGGLVSLGIAMGDSVTIALPNIPQGVFALYGANKIGAVANMVHPLLPAAKIVECMKKTGSTTIFLLDQVYAKTKDIFDKEDFSIILCGIGEYLPVIKSIAYSLSVRKDIKDNKRLKFNELLHFAPTDTDDEINSARVYLHSGGTTGSPKTIKLSNFNINALSSDAKRIISANENDTLGMLASLPMFHGFGLCMGIHAPIVNGFCSILVPKFDMKMIVQTMKSATVTFMTGVPTMFEKLMAYDSFKNSKKLKNLQIAFCGGDSMPQILKTRFDEMMAQKGSKCVMLEGYGLTETVTVCTVNTKTENRIGSIGKPLTGVKVKIVNEKGEQVPPNTYGEIAIAGDTVMLGYLNDEEGTKETLKEGYIYSGDYGHMDEDGYVYFKQRLKRIIKVSGVAVFPSEIEDAAAKLPEVNLASALCVPDEKLGSAVKLCVVLNQGFERTEETKAILKTKLKEHLIKWAVPKHIEFMDSLPLTLVGKVDFRELEKQLNEKTVNTL